MMRTQFTGLAALAALAVGLGLGVAAQQKPAVRAGSAAPAAGTVVVFKSPT